MGIRWFCHALDTERGHRIYAELRDAAKESNFLGPVTHWVAPNTWEDSTLRILQGYCKDNPEDFVLYTHTKGAFRDEYLVDKATGRAAPHSLNDLWRGSMIDRLIRAHSPRMRDLEENDICGMYWVEPPEVTRPYFAGNFWWARADYVARLPELPVLTVMSRHEAEKWVASGNPRVKALSCGFDSIPFPQTEHPATRILATSAIEAEATFACAKKPLSSDKGFFG